MALSGTFSNSYRSYTYQISWSATQNVSGNYSTITCTHKLVCPSGWPLEIGSRTNTCTVGNDSKNFTSSAISTGGGQTLTLGTTKHTVYHNSSTGAATFTISSVFYMQANISSVYVNTIAVSGSATLNTIVGASTISSVSNVTLGNKCSVTFTPASASFQYDIKFSLGSWAASTGKFTPGKTSAYTYNYYTIPANDSTLLSQISGTSGTMTATLTTYNSSGTQIGSTSSKTFTVYKSSTGSADGNAPTVGTITLSPQDYSYLIQGKNKLKISISGSSAASGRNIVSYAFSGPGISTTTTSTSVTTSTISNTGTLTYTVTVTDNKGSSTSKTQTITCYAYSAPYFTSFTTNKSNTQITCNYNISYSSVNNSNKITAVTIYYKSGSSTSYSSKTATASASGSCTISGLSSSSTYSVYAVVKDYYGGSSTSNSSASIGESRIFNATANGLGFAVGMKSSNAGGTTGLYECAWDSHFYKGIEADGDISATNITASSSISVGGNTLLNSDNYTDYTSPIPVELYSNASGITGTFSLTYSAANYNYLEIFYADNNGRQPQSIRVYSPNGKIITLSCIEPRNDGAGYVRLYIRTMKWVISDTSIFPEVSDTNGAPLFCTLVAVDDTTNNEVDITIGTNYIKIYRVLGYN